MNDMNMGMGNDPIQALTQDDNAQKKPIDNANDIDMLAERVFQLTAIIYTLLIPTMQEMANRLNMQTQMPTPEPEAEEPIAPTPTPPAQGVV